MNSTSPVPAGPGLTLQPSPARCFITRSALATHWALPSWRWTRIRAVLASPNSCSDTSPTPSPPTVRAQLVEMDGALLGAHLDGDAALEVDAEIEAEHEDADQRQRR